MSKEFKGIRCHSIAIPFIPVGHPRYVWRGHADTDVQRTWRTYGWKSNAEIAAAQVRTTPAPLWSVRKKG